MLAKCALDHIDSMFYVQLGCFVIVSLSADCLTYIIRNITDIAFRRSFDRCGDSPASRVSQHDDHISIKMRSRILYTSQLVVIQYISCHADHKKLSDACGKDCLRYLSGIRAGDHDGIGMLTVFSRSQEASCT